VLCLIPLIDHLPFACAGPAASPVFRARVTLARQPGCITPGIPKDYMRLDRGEAIAVNHKKPNGWLAGR
jgi:hypothetical protein